MLIVIVKDMNKVVSLIKPADPSGKNRQDFKSKIGPMNLELVFVKAVKRCSSVTALYISYREI